MAAVEIIRNEIAGVRESGGGKRCGRNVRDETK